MNSNYNRDDGLPESVGRFCRPESTYSEAIVAFGGAPANQTWTTFAAAYDGDTVGLETLLAKNPALAACNLDYHHPLHFAVRANKVEAVQVLLAHGANVLTESRLHGINQTLDWAKERGFQEIHDLLDQDRRDKFDYSPEAVRVTDAIRRRGIKDLKARLADDTSLVHARDESGNRPVHWAVMTGQMEAIDLLLENGADINVKRFDGARSLDLIDGDYWYWHQKPDGPDDVPEKKALVAGYLLARGADYHLIDAARFGDMGRIRQLIASDPDCVNEPPGFVSWGVGSPLGFAASQGREDMLRYLLECGADPNMREGNLAPTGSALYHAVAEKHVDLVKILLEHGANPDCPVESSGDAYGGAQGEIRELLVSFGALPNPDHGYGRFTEVMDSDDKGLLDDMLAKYTPEWISQTELEYAAGNNRRDIVDKLLEMNPSLWERVSTHGGDGEMLGWLLQKGMDPNLPTWCSETPVHRAARVGASDSLSLLLASGGRTDPIEAQFESTPLGLAARYGHEACVAALLDAGADPELSGADWSRPIVQATREGHETVAALLKDGGGT